MMINLAEGNHEPITAVAIAQQLQSFDKSRIRGWMNILTHINFG